MYKGELNLANIDSVLEILLSNDNKRRTEAENYINGLPATNFDEFIDALLRSMASADTGIAQMAALLLKKKYLDNADNLKMISQPKLEFIVQSVQACMSVDKKTAFLKRCCDILVKVFIQLNQSKQLLNVVATLSNSEVLSIKLTLYYLIETIVEFAFDDDATLIENSAALELIFQKGLQDENNEVRLAAFKTLTIFLSSINDEKLVKRFQGVLAILLTKCIQAIKYDQQSGKIALQSLNELIEIHPKFIKPIMGDLLRIFGEIMETSMLNSKLRITAMHGVLLLCMNHESSIRKNDYFKTKMVAAYMKMLSENEKITLEEWASELNDEIISKDDVSMATEEHLSQILVYLGVKFMLPLFIGPISQALLSPNSNDQHAGLAAMSILTEGSQDIFKNDLPKIVSLILPLMETSNPRVMNDVITVFGYLSDEFCPEIQNNYGKMILTLIVKGLSNPLPKLQLKSVQCIQNYCGKLDDHKQQIATILPFLDTMLCEIGKIFEWGLSNNNFVMMDAVLGTLCSISSIASFEKYYNNFMPGLKKLVAMISGENTQQSLLRNKTVECIGYLLTSIKDNPTMFASECQVIMESLLTMEDTLDKDDALHSAMFKVYAQVVSVLKENFVYAPRIIDRCLNAITAKVDCKVIDEAETQPENKASSKMFKLKLDLRINGGIKNIVLNTDSLEQKIQGANLLVGLAANMGFNFGPFIEKCIDPVLSHISFKHSKHIRHNMVVMVKLLTCACQTPEQKVFVLNKMMPSLMNELTTGIKLQNEQDIGLALEVITEVMPFCPEQLLMNLPALLSSVLSVTKSLVSEIEKDYADKEMDEDLQNQMQTETEEVEELYEHVEKIIKLAGNRPEYQMLKKGFPADYEFDQA